MNKKITEIACATSSSLALITGAVAAIADPPQIDEPTPIKVAIVLSNLNNFCKTYAIINEMEIVIIMMGNDDLPTFITCMRFSPKPNKTTAVCKIYLDVKAIPLLNNCRFW